LPEKLAAILVVPAAAGADAQSPEIAAEISAAIFCNHFLCRESIVAASPSFTGIFLSSFIT